MTRLVIDNGFDNMRRDADLGHAGNGTAPDVVHSPGLERLAGGGLDGSIKPLLANMPTVESSCTDAEDQVATRPVRLCVEDCADRGADWDDVAAAVLATLWRQHDSVAVNF